MAKNKKQAQGALSEKELKALWAKELKENKSIQQYLSDFEPSSVERFEEDYLQKKYFWMSYGPYYTEDMETEDIQWTNTASNHLEIILQKKLFDIQCRWRAEELTLDGIEISHQFQFWEKDILNCPFIEPLTMEDIELYQAYLNSSYDLWDENNYFGFSYQDYDEIKEAYEDAKDATFDFPDWYEFHNSRKGTGALMLLPDVRGEKERFYLELYHSTEREKNKEAREANEKNRDRREWLRYYEREFTDWFVTTFESKEVQLAYRSYEWHQESNDRSEGIRWEMNLLLSAKEKVPIEANEDWLEGIRNTAKRYERMKIAEALPLAWEQYKMNVDMGIGFPISEGDIEHGNYITGIYRNNIIQGRILNGEPGDLNF